MSDPIPAPSVNETVDGVPVEDIYYRSDNDLLLYARGYGTDNPATRPVLCLSGLTRNGRDFHALAVAFASHPTNPRRVYCLDYRGRGKSEWDSDWENYSPIVEMGDVLAFMTLRGIADAAFVGTSRGGIISMLIAVAQPSAIGCLVLNDIGPVIETAGLARIMGYTGKVPVPRDWDEAARVVRDMNRRQFTQIDGAGWTSFARAVFNESDGAPAAGYDPSLSRSLAGIDIAKPIADMWTYFEALNTIPVMVLRGEHSDLLSAATVAEMQARHPRVTAVTVQNEGHAPLLVDRFTQRLITDFIAQHDSARARSSGV